jgi:hypothetical protein
MKMTEHQEDIRDAIRRMFDLDCTYLESVAISADFGGLWAQERRVEVFAIHGHPNAILAYAWSVEEAQETQYTVVLGIPSINSPVMAIEAAIALGHL